MSSYIRMSLAILVVCVIQPITGLGYYTEQLQRMEKMLSSIQKISKVQEKIRGREMWLMEQIHCTLLSTEDRGKGSNPESKYLLFIASLKCNTFNTLMKRGGIYEVPGIIAKKKTKLFGECSSFFILLCYRR